MCKKCDITRIVIDNMVNNRKEFTYDELIDKIKEEGGIMRIAPCVTVKDYLDFFEDNKVVRYIPREKKYKVCS